MTGKYLIVGLGNPGRKYEKTRHNVGFHTVEELARRYGLKFNRKSRKALTASGTIKGEKVILAKPQTYMNVSGQAVRSLVDFHKIEHERILVIHDDLDTPLGILRLRKAGGHGGQKGVQSIIQHIGTRDFNRARIGIGRPPGKMDPAKYVLTTFKGDDKILAREVVERAADAVETWLTEGIEVAMSRHNGDGTQPDEGPAMPLEEELALYERAHELAPFDPAPLEKMVWVLIRLGRPEEAARRHIQIAELYLMEENTAKAIVNQERAAKLNPDLIQVHWVIAQEYEELGNKRKAAQRLLILAGQCERQGDVKEALLAVQEALRINPQHPKALEMMLEIKKRLTL